MAGRFRLSFDREREISALAERVASAHFSDQRVDPEQIATAEKIAFRYASFPEDFDGVLIHEGGRFFIICNDHVSPRGSARSRFTFSHELGHYFLHREVLMTKAWPAHYSRTDFTSDEPLEVEADVFAANLLLPEKPFRVQAGVRSGSAMDKIEALATHFGTSLTATAYRALELNLFPAPAALFRWNVAGQQIRRRMSEQTAILRREYLALADSPPPGSVTERAIAVFSDGTNRGRSPVMSWFPKLTGYGTGDHSMLVEEVKSLSHFGFLTLVYADRH